MKRFDMVKRSWSAIVVLVAALSLLSACESAKDKAARHMQAALEMVQKGDATRALVEFRNVFQFDPNNRDARIAFASLLRDQGNLLEAYAQYQHVTDLNPQDVEALQAASRLAADLGRWTEAGHFADVALTLNPAEPGLLAVKAGVDYAAAFNAADAAGRAKAAATAQNLLATQPDNLLLHRVVINNLMQNADYPAALHAIDAALAIFPKEKGLYQARVTVLTAQEDDAGVEAELKKLAQLFPDDSSLTATLLSWYVSKNRIDDAEATLRVAADKGDLTADINLVNFLRQFRSADAALAEIDKILASLPAKTVSTAATPAPAVATDGTAESTPAITPDLIRMLRASILFDQGKQEEGIKAMQDILVGAAPSDQTRQIKVMLARMLFATGDTVQARAQVGDVLTEDAGQVDALKLKAAWLIDDDKTDDAIALLRKALNSNPHDAQAMSLTAQAYDRAGNHAMTGDMLSQAAIASGKAPAESIRYAQFLIEDAKYLPAESLLIDALRLDPANISILDMMGRLYVLMKDWPRATGIADRLDELATSEALAANQSLRPAILAGQQKVGAAIDYLKTLAASQDANLKAKVTLLQAYLGNGQTDKARALADDLLAKAPQDDTVRFIAATVKGATGDSGAAETIFRALLKADPKRETVWVALVHQIEQDDKASEAEAVLDEALANLPDSDSLQLIKAGYLEHNQDPEGAIAIYEKLYAKASANMILANNLASMLASYRSDATSLDQAYTVARRLRGTKNPFFADTYGWITQIRGNPTEALPYLEIAAGGLPKDPLVQFHLAEVYKALNRTADAKTQYAKVLELVTATDTRDFVLAARKAVGQG